MMYDLHLKQKMEEGMADIEAGRTIPFPFVRIGLMFPTV